MRVHSLRLLAASLPVVFAIAGSAQDTRKVTEPHIPAACVSLDAGLASINGNIAPADESKLDTARIQNAIDGCAPGKAVVLRARGSKNIFLTGPLALRTGVTLVVSANTALVASRDPRLYDLQPGSCGLVNEKGHGCKPLITGDGATNSGIMGDGSIDGRGGATLLGQNVAKNVTWWDLAHQAKIEDKQQSVFQLIALRHADNFTMYNITLRNSPNFQHVAVNQTDGFTAWGVKIMTPQWARNTDGIDPGASRNVTITHCSIYTGDDDVAVKSSKSGLNIEYLRHPQSFLFRSRHVYRQRNRRRGGSHAGGRPDHRRRGQRHPHQV